jgi:hypothetical protein
MCDKLEEKNEFILMITCVFCFVLSVIRFLAKFMFHHDVIARLK